MFRSLTHLPREKRIKKWVGYLLFFILGSLLSLGIYTYFTREKSPSPEAFSQKVFIADQVVNSHLYEMGISKKDVLPCQFISKKEGDITWEQSLLKIQLPRSLLPALVEENFKRNFSLIGEPFFIQSSRTAESLVIEVKVMDRITHQLSFLYVRPSALEMKFRPKVVIVIDDLGMENHIFQEILHWDVPLTFSIMPFTPYSKRIALEAQQRGKEVILHLPMEPFGYPKVKPGEGALLYEMDDETLLRQLSKDIESIPDIKGVSNHMGSRLMEDPEKMKIILSELKKRGLFFLDSRTTPNTVGLKIAKSLNMRATGRNIFLDNSQNEKDIKQQLEKLIRLTLSTGRAIAIGHPHPSTIESLKEMIPKMQEEGIEIVPLSSVIE